MTLLVKSGHLSDSFLFACLGLGVSCETQSVLKHQDLNYQKWLVISVVTGLQARKSFVFYSYSFEKKYGLLLW